MPVNSTINDKTNINTKPFKGEGTGVLHVPGCLKVTSVRVGTVDVPEIINSDVPDPMNPTRIVVENMLGWKLVEHDGMPTLLRSRKSNDGIWQAGVTILVTGDWQDTQTPAGAETELPEAPDANTGKTKKD